MKLLPQLTFACSKSTIKTLEKGVKYVQRCVRCFYCQLKTYFTLFSSASIVDLEQVNVSREDPIMKRFANNQPLKSAMFTKKNFIIDVWQGFTTPLTEPLKEMKNTYFVF